jgi:hypothetical protein
MPPELERCVAGLMQDKKMIAKYPDEKVRRSHAFAICNSSIKNDEGEYTFLVDLTNVELAEGEGKWVQILPVASVKHPRFGDINIDDKKLDAFVANFKANVRGHDLDIDYAHKRDTTKGDKAAGWIKDLAHRAGSGLWGLVEFTSEAVAEIKQKAWRYLSAEYRDAWTDPAGKTHTDVLFGAGLTNRPFMGGMAPINLSELDVPVDELPPEPIIEPDAEFEAYLQELSEISSNYMMWEDGAYTFTPFKFRDIPPSEREKHPASDFAGKGNSFPIFNCSDVSAAFHSLGRAGADNLPTATIRSNIIRIAKRKGCPLPQSVKGEEVNMDPKELAKLLGLKEDADEAAITTKLTELKTFQETHKDVETEKAKKFAEDYPEEFKQMQEDRKARKLAEANVQIKEWEAKGLPPAAAQVAKALLLGEDTIKLGEGDKATEVAVSPGAVVDSILKTGLVKLGNRAADDHGEPILTDDPTEELANKVGKYLSEHKDEKLSYRDARRIVLGGDKELAKRLLEAAPVAHTGNE